MQCAVLQPAMLQRRSGCRFDTRFANHEYQVDCVRVLHSTPVVVQSTLSLQAAYDRSASHLHGFINIVLDSHARAHARLSAYELQRGATRCCSIVPRIATCVS